MAKLGINFDANTVAPAQEMGPVPADHYVAAMTKSEMKVTGKKTGSYLSVEYSILEGVFKGRKIFENLNLVNPNATAVEIAHAQLSALCHATGVLMLDDSLQLHNIPFDLKVGVQPEGPGEDGKVYPARNTVMGYKNLADSDISSASGFAGAGTSAGADSPAWANQQQAAQTQAAPAAAAPAPSAPVAAPAPQFQTVNTMTALAKGATYEQFIANGWTDATMIEKGFMTQTQVAVEPPAAPAPTGAPPWQQAATPANGAPAAADLQQPSAATTEAAPPWAK